MSTSVARPHWSYSAVSQYLRCPLQFYFERVARLPRRSATDARVLGSALHTALAAHHRRLQARRPATPRQVRQDFLAAWAGQADRAAVVATGGRSVADSRDLGIALIEAYLREPAPERIVAVERPVLAPIVTSRGDYLERPMLAIADLVTRQEDGTLRVVEIATSGRAYSASEVATSLQLTCYAAALFETTGAEPAVEFRVLVKARVPKVQAIRATRGRSDYRRLGDIVGAVERGVDSGVFYPVESPMNCSGCPFYRPCRAWPGPTLSRRAARGEAREGARC